VAIGHFKGDALVAWGKSMSDAAQTQAKADEELTASSWRRERIRDALPRGAIGGRNAAIRHRPPDPRWGHYLRARLGTKIIERLRHLGGHEGTTLLLRNALEMPFWWNKWERGRLRQDPEGSYFAHDASHRLILLMGAAGFRPLVERHDVTNDYFFVHAKGQEEVQLNTGFRDTHFKLPSEPATIHPNKFIGPSLGTRLGNRLDMVCPDVVAYILIEKRHRWLRDTGPRFFRIAEIENEIVNGSDHRETLKYLRERHFEIEPDFLEGQSHDLGLGGVSDVNVLGPLSGDEPKYMRFDCARLKHDEDEEHAGAILLAFRNALQDIGRRQRIPMDWNRGDVLFVNNRRVATQWLPIRRERKWFHHETHQRDPLMAGDRVVLRMSFYSPVKIPTSSRRDAKDKPR
jgi:hypothetical protein